MTMYSTLTLAAATAAAALRTSDVWKEHRNALTHVHDGSKSKQSKIQTLYSAKNLTETEEQFQPDPACPINLELVFAQDLYNDDELFPDMRARQSSAIEDIYRSELWNSVKVGFVSFTQKRNPLGGIPNFPQDKPKWKDTIFPYQLHQPLTSDFNQWYVSYNESSVSHNMYWEATPEMPSAAWEALVDTATDTEVGWSPVNRSTGARKDGDPVTLKLLLLFSPTLPADKGFAKAAIKHWNRVEYGWDRWVQNEFTTREMSTDYNWPKPGLPSHSIWNVLAPSMLDESIPDHPGYYDPDTYLYSDYPTIDQVAAALDNDEIFAVYLTGSAEGMAECTQWCAATSDQVHRYDAVGRYIELLTKKHELPLAPYGADFSVLAAAVRDWGQKMSRSICYPATTPAPVTKTIDGQTEVINADDTMPDSSSNAGTIAGATAGIVGALGVVGAVAYRQYKIRNGEEEQDETSPKSTGRRRDENGDEDQVERETIEQVTVEMFN